jgi:hypothetical protein
MEATCVIQEDFIVPVPDAVFADLSRGEREEKVKFLEARADNIRGAQDAWAKLNFYIQNLGPLPPDVLEGWDRIKPWLNREGQDVMLMLGYQQRIGSDVVWR